MVYQPEMPQYSIEFFALFSRFEYALKAAGMWMENPNNGAAEVKWSKVEKRKELAGILGDLRVDALARPLMEKPPKKQIILDGMLAWSEDEPPIVSMQQLTGMIRRVRNNLFHGSKSIPPMERDEALIRASIRAVQMLAERLPDVAERFPPEG